MWHSALSYYSIVFLLLVVGPARSGEDPQAIIARAVQALGGEANLVQARAVQAKIKGTIYDPGVKESFTEGAKFTGEVITQLPTQEKVSLHVETAAGRLIEIRVLNGHKAWTRDNEQVQADNQASVADFEQSAYVDYVSSLVPLLKDKGYTLTSVAEK